MNSVPHLSVLVAASALAAGAAGAQPTQERHRIAVTTTADQCTYTIQDQADQTLFVVEPGGQVQFQPRGPRVVKVTVRQDPESGVEGGEGVRQMWVTNSRPRVFPVRTDLDLETTHEVVIECCTVGNRRRTCPEGRFVRAVPEREGLGQVGHGLSSEAASGPAAGPPPRGAPVDRRAGPRMKVVQ